MADEPVGLGMSLDDLIGAQQQKQSSGYGKQRRGPQDRRVHQGGRGGRRQDQQQWGGGGGGGPRYDLRAPHQQQQQQPQQQHDPHAYREDQSCWQEDNGEVVFRFKRTDLVRIDTQGNITLNSGGFYNCVTLASLNDCLNLIGIRVTCPSGDVRNSDCSISDGRSLTRFEDGVVLRAKGPQQAARGRQLLAAFNNPHHAAQAASMAASNAAATVAGIMPFAGFVPPGVPASQPQPQPRGGGGREGSSVFARLQPAGGGRQQGRYAPY